MFGLIRKKGEDKMGDFNLCPKCGGVPSYKLVGDNRTLIVAICSECGYCPAKSGDARYTEKEALKIWNKRTSEISHKLWKLKNRWIVKGDLLVCPQCNVAQKKPKETEPTPFCPICGAWLTNETAKEWISKNTVSSKVPEGRGIRMKIIDADAIIEVMKKCAENPENEQALLCYRYTQRILEEAPTVEPASPWHMVEDGLPEPYVQCLVRDNDNNCAVGYYRQDAKAWDSPFFGWIERDDEYYKDGDLCRIGKVVAWMPIEPPKEDA